MHTTIQHAQVENFGAMRYERSREVLAHGRVLTQRHEATNAEIAMNAGDRPLVRFLCFLCVFVRVCVGGGCKQVADTAPCEH